MSESCDTGCAGVVGQQLLEKLVNNAPIPIAVVEGPEFRYVLVNRAYCAIEAKTEADFLGRSIAEVFPEVVACGGALTLQQAYQTGRSISQKQQEFYLRPSREQTWWNMTYVPLHNDAGQACAVLIMAEDVSEQVRARRRVEEQTATLQESEERLKLATEAADAGLWEWDTATGAIVGSDQASAMHGLPPGMPLDIESGFDTFHPDDHATVRAALERALQGVPYEVEYRSVWPDGTVHWLAGKGRLHGTRLLGLVQDITERKLAEERVGQLAKVVENSSNFVGVSGLDRRALYVNSAGQALVGLEDDDAVRTTTVEDYLFPEDIPFWRDTVMPTVMSQGRWKGEFRLRHLQTGEPIAVIWDVFRIDDSQSGQPINFATIIRDIRAQKAAEQTIRESEELLRLAEQAGNVGSFEWNVQTDHMRVSAEYAAIYGLEPGLLSDGGRAWSERAHPDDLPIVSARFAEISARREPQAHLEYRIIRPDGQVRWIEARIRLTYDAEGNPSRVIGVNLDITERKEAEETLREREELLRLAEHAGNIGSFEWIPQRDRLRISTGYAAIYGLEPGLLEPSWAAWTRLVHPDDLPWIEALIAETADRRESYTELEFRVLRPDGQMRWVEARAQWFYDTQGRRLRVIGVNVDITERKHAEQALRESEEFLRLAEQAGNVGSFEWNVQTGHLRLSPGCLAFYGFEPDAFDGTYASWIQRLHPAERERMEALIRRVFAGHETQYQDELRIVRSDGQLLWLEGRFQITYDETGTPRRVVGVEVDITARKRIEEALRESEGLLRLAEQAGNVGSFEWNVQTGQLRLSPGCQAIYGFQPEAYDGTYHAWTSRLRPDERQSIETAIQVAFAQHETHYKDELRIVRPDGQARWLEDRFQITYDEEGRPLRVFGVKVDITDRKRIEEALRESEATLRGFFDANAVYMSVVEVDDADIVYLVSNPRVAAFFGLSVEEFAGKHGRELGLPEEFIAEWVSLIRQCQETQRPISSEYPVPYRGSDGWFHGTISPLPPGASGRPRGALAAVDITDRKRAEEALRESEELFRLATEATNGVVYDWDRTTGRTWRSANLFDVVGYHPDEVSSENDWWRSLIHPDDLASRDPTVIAPDTSLRTVEYRVRHKAGHYVWVWDTARIVRNAEGEADRVVGCTVSIDARKRAEEALRESEERFRLATEANFGVVYDWDVSADRTWRSPGLVDVVGYTTEEVALTGEGWWGLCRPDDRAKHDQQLAAAVAARAPVLTTEYRVRHKDGRYVWVWDRARLVYDQEGRLARIIGTTVSIDDRKRVEERLKALNDTLEQQVAERTAVSEQRAAQLRVLAAELSQAEEQERRRLAKVLHDHLQQLLVAARMKIAILRRRTEEERQVRTLEQIDDVLNQAITESRSLTVELSPPVLYDAGLGAGLEWLARQMEEKHGLRVVVDTDAAAEPADEGTRVFLFQAVRELLLNVVKHAQTDVAHVELLPLDSDRLQLVVADPGVGFDFSAMEGRGVSGGFGLFSIRERLELLGGRLVVETSPRLGTRMMIEVPRGRLTPVSGVIPAEPIAVTTEEGVREVRGSPVGPEKTRVVLADDHAIVRQGLAGLLRDQGTIEVVGEAADGRQAVEVTLETRPDVVLMDVTMPGLNGMEATRRILNALPEVRVIGLSMHEEADMAAAMRKAGAVAYLRKDTDTEVLISAIHARPLARQEART